MPSIKVTPTKGLFQAKGTSTIPNGSLSGAKRVVLGKTASYTVQEADNGKIIALSGGAVDAVILPSPVDCPGWHFSVVSASAGHAHVIKEASAGAVLISLMSQVATGNVNTRAHAVTSLTLSAGVIGDRFEIYSDGAFWIVKSSTNATVTAA